MLSGVHWQTLFQSLCKMKDQNCRAEERTMEWEKELKIEMRREFQVGIEDENRVR
jgi:hypothetical protein